MARRKSNRPVEQAGQHRRDMLLQLPLELRHQIYAQCINKRRYYCYRLTSVRRRKNADNIMSLLLVNKQVSDEVLAWYPKSCKWCFYEFSSFVQFMNNANESLRRNIRKAEVYLNCGSQDFRFQFLEDKGRYADLASSRLMYHNTRLHGAFDTFADRTRDLAMRCFKVNILATASQRSDEIMFRLGPVVPSLLRYLPVGFARDGELVFNIVGHDRFLQFKYSQDEGELMHRGSWLKELSRYVAVTVDGPDTPLEKDAVRTESGIIGEGIAGDSPGSSMEDDELTNRQVPSHALYVW